MNEEETLEFEVNRWLDVAEDDGDVVRELAAEWPDEEPLPGTVVPVLRGHPFCQAKVALKGRWSLIAG